MNFQNFGNFGFMNDMLAEDLTITIPGHDTGDSDELGRPIMAPATAKKVHEPIVNSTNPNMTYTPEFGGQLPVGTLYWLSGLVGCPKGTKVQRASGATYEVINHGDDFAAGRVYYQLKEVGTDE